MKSNDKSIKQKPTAKLLGITFDCNLTYNEIDLRCIKSTQYLQALYAVYNT